MESSSRPAEETDLIPGHIIRFLEDRANVAGFDPPGRTQWVRELVRSYRKQTWAR
jgi:hypothetical protein